jgi:hypothetical protein
MKINEITQNVNEAPVGAFKQGLRSIGARAAGAVGMGTTAASLSGKAATGQQANTTKREFAQWLGRQMKNIKQATAEDLITFLKQSKLPVDHIEASAGVLAPRDIDTHILTAVAAAARTSVPSNTNAPAKKAPAKAKPGVVDSFISGWNKS